MGLNHGWRGPNIVKDGLVLYLDAGSPNSYQGSGTTWKDISKVNQNNGTLTNGPTYSTDGSGSIVFDGVDDYANVSTFNQTFSSLTLGTWIKLSGPQSNFAGVIYSRGGGGSTTGLNFIGSVYGGNGYKVGLTYNNTGFTTPGPQLLDNTWTQVYLAFSPTSTVYYINGAPSLTLGSYGSSTTLASLKLGYDTDNASRVFKGSMAQTQIYNQALTQFQVWQNFNATKSRFGIPDIVTDGLVLNLDAGNPYSYLSGSSGTTWTDVSGQGNNGTLTNGPVYSNGAVTFDGVDDYVDCGTGVSLDMNNSQFTLLNIIKPAGSGERQLMSKGTYVTGNYQYRLDNSNRLTWWMNGHTPHTNSYSSPLTNGVWYFVGMVYYPNDKIELYVNGSLVKTTSISGTIGSNSQNFQVGAKLGTEEFNGNIALAQVYNRALTADEVLQNFNALRGRYGI